MTYILLYSENLEDVAEFRKLFDWFIYPKFEGRSEGEQTGVFKLINNDNEIKLTQDFKNNYFEKLLIENKRLKSKNKKLKKTLKKYLPRQDLSINNDLISIIVQQKDKGKSYQKIADFLNKKGFTNSRGNELNSMQVNRLYKKSLKKNN